MRVYCSRLSSFNRDGRWDSLFNIIWFCINIEVSIVKIRFNYEIIENYEIEIS